MLISWRPERHRDADRFRVFSNPTIASEKNPAIKPTKWPVIVLRGLAPLPRGERKM